MPDYTAALRAALQRLEIEAAASARDAAEAMGQVGERAIKLELSMSSHTRNTQTPSRPHVDPPSLITGQLRASVRRTRSHSDGPAKWNVHIAPTTVYARIQELGGIAGWHHRAHLPPRPYVRPAMEKSMNQARDAAVRAFRQRTGL
jgi:phage gpG-like protein